MKNINKIVTLNIASVIILQGISFFTIPIFTRILGADQYGIYSVFESWIRIVTCIMGLGIHSSIGTGMYQFKGHYYEFRNSTLLFGTFLSIAIIGISIILIKPISAITDYDYPLILILMITGMSHFIINYVQGAYTYEKRADLNFVISLVLLLSTVALSIFLIQNIFATNKSLGRIYGVTVPYTIVALVMWVVFFMKKPIFIKREYCKYSLLMGLPIVFHSLSQNVLGQSDRIMMQSFMLSDTEIGVYSFYYTFSAVISTLLNAFNNSWVPFYYEDVDAENWEKLNKKCRNYMEVFSLIVIGFLMLSREVSYLLAGSEYQNGANLIPILTMAVYFTFMYQFLVNFEYFHKKTIFIAVGTVSAAILNIILNAIMIPLWGMYGAAIATAISYGGLFVMHYIIVTNMKDYKYHLRLKSFVPGLFAVCAGTLLFYSLENFWYIRWGFGVALGIFEIFRIYKRRTIF